MSSVKDWTEQVDEIRAIGSAIGVSFGVEEDKSSRGGLDAKLILGDIPVVKGGNTYTINLGITMELSIPKDQWRTLLEKMNILSQKLSDDTNWLFDGWVRIEDDSNIIYQGSITPFNLITPD